MEDEPQSAESLSRLITKFHSSSVKVVAVVDSVDGFVSVCAEVEVSVWEKRRGFKCHQVALIDV
ncbi:MAG TPA: hypothetical protein VK957_15010 [Lunatimonas sp.]|nr:hypothetical protein [Lunatimonas sp.]